MDRTEHQRGTECVCNSIVIRSQAEYDLYKLSVEAESDLIKRPEENHESFKNKFFEKVSSLIK